MPTVLRVDGFVFKIHLNDHAPAHVHAIKDSSEAVITLEPVIALRCWHMREQDLSSARRIVSENQAALMKRWGEIHGK